MLHFDNFNIEDKNVEDASHTALSDTLHHSATDGDVPDYMIDFDPDYFDKCHPEVVAMREACASGDLIAVQHIFKLYLLGRTNDELSIDQLAASGLCEAIKRDDVIIARYLLSHVSMESMDFAMATEYHAYSILQLYIDKKWDINTYLGRMQPPALSLAIKDIRLTLWFLSHGADPNATCGLDITPLSIAVRDAPFEIIRILFDHGGSVEHGQLLHFAACREFSDRVDVLKYILDKGASVDDLMFANSADSFEQEWMSGLGTPLHSAARKGYLDAVNLLLSKGADPSLKNSQGELAIEKAEYHGNRDVVERLRSLC